MRNFNRGGSSRGGFRGGFGRGDRQMFDVVCATCGKDCKVPFKPVNDKPVYCSDCFEKMGNRSSGRSFDRPRFEDRNNQNNQCKNNFELLNTKLDKILNLLNSSTKSSSFTPIASIIEAPTDGDKIKPVKPKRILKSKAPKEVEKE